MKKYIMLFSVLALVACNNAKTEEELAQETLEHDNEIRQNTIDSLAAINSETQNQTANSSSTASNNSTGANSTSGSSNTDLVQQWCFALLFDDYQLHGIVPLQDDFLLLLLNA